VLSKRMNMKTITRHIDSPHLLRRLATVSTLVLTIILAAGCGDKDPEISSGWTDGDISVDGANTEWQDRTVFVESVDIVAGVVNDYDFLYVVLMTSERTRQMQLMRGVTMWFDTSGEKKKTFGIRFPLVMDDMSPMAFRQNEAQNRPSFEDLEAEMVELEVIGAGGPVERLPADGTSGIEVNLSRSGGVVVYELRVPLKADGQYEFAVGARVGELIQIGLETPEFERPEGMGGGRGMGGGGMPPGGMGGGRGGHGGSPPGGGRGGFEPPDPIKLWATVRLASPDQTSVN
jgi:hypothetical protein